MSDGGWIILELRAVDTALAAPTAVRRLAAKYGFTFRRSLGQNFLIDGNILRRIIQAAEISHADTVIEVGAGIGTLTRALGSTAGRVLALEVDRRLEPILQETVCHYDNVEIIWEDALKLDWRRFRELYGLSRVKFVANLPYYITSPLLVNLFQQSSFLESITVMVQREVGERFTAEPGTKAYGTLTVLAGYYSEVEICQIVPPTVFMPPPDVESAVVKFTLRPYEAEAVDPALFWTTVKAAFSQRRKTLANSLASGLRPSVSKTEICNILHSCGISPERRAETLTVGDFVVLANQLAALGLRDGK
ncbi:MAG: 16S rRNA (adenine(1518)-N(6)/adenine(1519)-N(6))-dimethyltransferase RsmA [Firmicutes bacterium]|nr:16S rRNA (adenine(1518)-N(6)/adenine(1519)-N(6))-dimethyltransferase RsmA [Bacillota bacterium]